jgi:anti-sigma B factor antagonist
MMNIVKKQSDDRLTIALEGRLDISTAPELEQVVVGSLAGVADLVFDLEKLSYISSAGLRVLLLAQKKMNKQGSMKVIHVNEMVMEVFVNMGFAGIMTIEQDKN